jgi:hypothetical protein
VTLTPAPSALGLASPALGPWFATSTVTLPAPATDLSVAVTLNAGDHWLPPATGLLSLYVATAQRPRDIASLRQASGDPAFSDGSIVAAFRLAPEVEARLDSLMNRIPAATGAAGASTVPTRARVRTLALELPSTATTFSTLAGMLDPIASNAEEVGLQESGTSLTNGGAAMRDLKRPGTTLGGQEKLIVSPTGGIGTAKLWAFDAGGRPIDPGAVAAWWAFLGTTFSNLFEASLTAADRRTVSTIDARLTAHLVNAHEGPLRPIELARLAFTNASGSDAVRTRTTGATGALTVSFTTAPSPDDLPSPEVALLPAGTYGAAVALWPAGPVAATLARDFVRLGVVSIEEHLIGQRRVAPGGTVDEVRRAADQERTSTRVLIGRTSVTGRTLLATTDEAASATTAVLGAGTARFVSSVLDADWAGLTPTALPAVAPPTTAPAITVRALTGGGTASGNVITGQRVLVELAAGWATAGSWVRAWPVGFDLARGRHVRLDGGGGRVATDGSAALVVTLPDGAANAPGPLALDLVVVTSLRARLFSDLRFTRPTPVGGTASTLPLTTADPVVECETAVRFAGNVAPSNVASGSILVVLSTQPALADRGSLPLSALTADTAGRRLTSGDVVQLTQPAFRGEPDGDAPASLGSVTGLTATRLARNALARVTTPVGPLPTMERWEIAAAQVSGATPTAAIATTPALSRFHELGPSQNGNPGAPAPLDIHGTGASLSGPAAVGVAEYVRDRTAGATPLLAVLAGTPLPAPAAPAAPSLWAAALRTVGADADAEPLVGGAAFSGTGGLYPFEGTAAQFTSWFAALGITIPAGTTAALNSIVRALDRRVLSAGWGAREAATSLRAAFARAEDYVYIESPAMTSATIGRGADTIAVWQALVDRMTQRRALVVIVCVPVRLLPGTPEPMQYVRATRLLEAVKALPDQDRVVVFSPGAGPGRSARMSSTTVIVDDAYALTGTTHLSRRGLSFDSSLATSVFDETLLAGRPSEIVMFRRALIAARLNVPLALLPDDPVDLLHALHQLLQRQGVGRLATDRIEAPLPVPSNANLDAWDVDGSRDPSSTFNVMTWIASLANAASPTLDNFTNPPPP